MSMGSTRDKIPISIENNLCCDNLPGGFLVYRASDGHVLLVNSQIPAIFGCETEEGFYKFTGGSFHSMVYEEDLSALRRNLSNVKKSLTISYRNSYRIVTRSGDCRYVEEYRRLVLTKEEGPVYFIFLSDISSTLTEFETDHITGLIGIRHFLYLTDEYIKEHADMDDVAMLFINLVNFRLLNMNLGLDARDKFLGEVSEKLQALFPDELITRVDVDHFVIFAKACNGQCLERKVKVVYESIVSALPNVMMDCKIGVYQWKGRDANAEAAFNGAKLACESIRWETHQYCAFFTDDTSRQLEINEYVIAHLDQALEENWILPYFQPVVRTISGKICALEALARWEDPKRGMLSPANFIPALEKNRQIHRMDLHIVEIVCRILRTQLDAGNDVVPISVNLSRLDFLCCDLYDEIEGIARKYRVPRDFLHLEITESAFVQNDATLKQDVNSFRDAGYEIWMDDFGSGYSTLSMLKDYSFDVLKMDMAFLANSSSRTRTIIHSIIEMDKNLGNRTLAEGVETNEQFEFLRNAGCDKAQGYYFGKPMPYDQCMEHCVTHSNGFEERRWRDYYSALSQVKFDTDLSLAICEFDGIYTKYLYANEKFLDVLKSGGKESLKDSESEINTISTPFGRAFHQGATYACSSYKVQTFDYPRNDQFLRLKVKKLAECEGKNLFAASLDNITSARSLPQSGALLENLYHIYDDIMLIDIKENMLQQVIVDPNQPQTSFDLRERLDHYAHETVAPADFDRFTEFIDLSTVKSRLNEAHKNTIRRIFRTRMQ